MINFWLGAVAVGPIRAEQESEEGEQICMFCFWRYFILAQLLLFLFCECLFGVFLFSFVNFWVFCFSFLFDISGALLSPAPNIVDIIIIVEREEYGTSVSLIVTIHSIVLKFFEKEREVWYYFDHGTQVPASAPATVSDNVFEKRRKRRI